ncbi:hypothetical protein FQA39_LY06211 [Lamprigera yunnana]|nr:hypothetical protein FQA39_LY06211 [Lamprigera yunnana]
MASNLMGTSALFLAEATTDSDNVQLDATILYGLMTSLSITAGAHRLWTHRSYKAKLPLRIILMFFQSGALQNHIYEWVRDHRVHHKFNDTDADPHNATRGFFFSHIGWLMVKKHKEVFNKGRTVDMSDVEADPVVRFQKSFYLVLVLIMCFAIPTFVPWYFWAEDGWASWYTAAILRYVLTLNGTWLINSAAHIWGARPYDTKISARENFHIALFSIGECWHNYHHVFPWDYKAAELGDYRLNLTTMVIDFFAKIGWAYDLKTVSVDMIKKRIKRTGDISAINCDNNTNASTDFHHEEVIWGWGDKDMRIEDIDDKTKISENIIDGEEEEGGTADEPATATPVIESSNFLSKTPGSDKSPAAGKRRKLENLTQAVQQLRKLSQNIQDSSNNEHEAFRNFVAATLNNLAKADALMAQHETQGVLFKYRLANVDASKHSYSNHSIDIYPHQQYSDNTNSTFYSDKHTTAPEKTKLRCY